MVTFYRDKVDTFSCKVNVKGTTQDKCTARLVLTFSDGMVMMFGGSIGASGICEIKVPKLDTEETGGKAKLEIIANGVLLSPWQDKFKIENAVAAEVSQIKVAEFKFTNNALRILK